MNKLFAQQIAKSVLVYLDDILVYIKKPEDHNKHLKEVFEIFLESTKALLPTPQVSLQLCVDEILGTPHFRRGS